MSQEELSYHDGLLDGWCDLMILSEPIRTGLHTYDKYLQVDNKYKLCVFNPNPSNYERGYGDGGDLAAIYLGPCRANGFHCKGCYDCDESDT